MKNLEFNCGYYFYYYLLLFLFNILFGIYQKGIISSYEGNVIFINFLKWFLF